MIDSSDCPVLVEAQTALEIAKTLTKAVRRLRAALQLCRHCTTNPDTCNFIRDLNRQITMEILLLNQEWNMV